MAKFYDENTDLARAHSEYHFSRVAVLPNGIAKTCGICGWDDKGELDDSQPEEQIKMAFQNIEVSLRAAGLNGWEDVYAVRSYHTDIQTSFPIAIQMMKRFSPNHRPTWAAVQTALALPGCIFEIEVEAYRAL